MRNVPNWRRAFGLIATGRGSYGPVGRKTNSGTTWLADRPLGTAEGGRQIAPGSCADGAFRMDVVYGRTPIDGQRFAVDRARKKTPRNVTMWKANRAASFGIRAS